MKKFIFALSVFALSVFGISLAPAAFAVEGDPIPGVDVSVEQSPVGIVVAKVTTDASGEFMFSNLAEGKYAIRIISPKDRLTGIYYTTPKVNAVVATTPTGSTEGKISINFVNTGPNSSIEPIIVTIGAQGGRIGGAITGLTTITAVPSSVSSTASVNGEVKTEPAGVSQNYNSSKSNTAGVTVTPVAPKPAQAGNNYNSAKSNTAGITVNASTSVETHTTIAGAAKKVQESIRNFFKSLSLFFSFKAEVK